MKSVFTKSLLRKIPRNCEPGGYRNSSARNAYIGKFAIPGIKFFKLAKFQVNLSIEKILICFRRTQVLSCRRTQVLSFRRACASQGEFIQVKMILSEPRRVYRCTKILAIQYRLYSTLMYCFKGPKINKKRSGFHEL